MMNPIGQMNKRRIDEVEVRPPARTRGLLSRRSMLRFVGLGGVGFAGGLISAGDSERGGGAWFASSSRAAESDRRGSFQRVPTLEEIRSAGDSYWRLVDLINRMRRKHRLPDVPLSPRMTVVAALHVRDLAHKSPHADGASLHSWSRDARWTGGQYKPNDKETFPIMWEKPKELTGYAGYGFEIAASNARDGQYALEAWLKSRTHSDVMLNRGIWADERWQWRALGAVFYEGFACAWFGDRPDEDEDLEE